MSIHSPRSRLPLLGLFLLSACATAPRAAEPTPAGTTQPPDSTSGSVTSERPTSSSGLYSADEALRGLPVVVYTSKQLLREESERLQQLARSLVVKGAESAERLLHDTALFLHRDATVDISRFRIVKNIFPQTAGKYAGKDD